MTWDIFYNSINDQKITVGSAIFKLFLSLIAGGLVGLNREQHKEPAGFRTHILICQGATLLMILSIYIPQTYFDFKNGDPGRIAAQVVSGIGFLGAGAIIRLGNNVKGLTTAASIWLISAIGLAIGAGLYMISLVSLIFTLFTLIILGRFEHILFPKLLIKTLILEFNEKNFPDEEIKDILKKFKIRMSDYNLSVLNDAGNYTEIRITAKIPEHTDLTKLVGRFNKLHAIRAFKIS
jgi:putative Mg2+ transporter-C (MgtC) family protein